MVDRGEDPELHETPSVSSTDPLTENAGKNRGGNFDQDGRDDFAVDDEKTTDIETWVAGKMPAQNQWQFCPHDVGQALWQAAGQRRHQHHRRTNKLVGTASVDLSGPHQGTPMIGGKVGSRQGHYFVVLHLRPDRSVGHKSIATQTISEDDPAAGEIPDAAAEEADSLMPFLYAEVLSHKADASAGVQRLLARARDDHDHLPNHIVFRCHSDRGQEFLNRSLEKYCEEHAIRRTTTQGYDPSANGAGENAVGYLKRKARQLLMGSRLPCSWWGPAVLAAAHYSRCAAGLEKWPRLGFGTRAMVVLDPEPRDCFAPRSVPATIFGPSERVSGAYVVYQQGKLKDAVNVQATDLTPQELVYVKAQLQNWDCPEAPQKPPSSDLWDASKVDISVPGKQGHQLRGDRLLPADAEPQEHEEAPLKEELPERPLIRPEEVLETLDQEPEISDSWFEPFASSCHADNDAISRRYVHACLTLSQISATGATHGRSEGSLAGTTVGSSNADASEFLDESDPWDDGDFYEVGPQFQSFSVPSSHGDNLREQGSEGSEHQNTTEVAEKSGTDQQSLADPSGALEIREIEDEVNRPKKGGKKSKTQFFAKGALATPVPQSQDLRTVIVEENKVREATGATRERWVTAAEKEYVENFIRMNAYTETTPEELAEIGGQSKVLPMKCVWSIKEGDLYKCRAVVCGNYADKDPSEEVYTAQAETASVMLGLKYAQMSGWETWKLDVKSAFLNAPLPEELLVVVRPPRAWVRMGIVKGSELWTLRKAVYGLRVSPRAWGIERDLRLRELSIKAGDQQYHLKQSRMDSQVWMIAEKNQGKDKFKVLGLIICYVDDMLCLMEDGKVKQALFEALQSLWTMSTEVKLEKGQKILYLGLELEHTKDGTLEIHQESFVKMILLKHGLDETSKSLSTVSINHPTEKDLPPDPATLRKIQEMAGEFN